MGTKVTGNLWESTCREAVHAPPLAGRKTVDLVVIGGGYTGMAAALEAARAGAGVCLIEAAEIGHGGSGRNVGLVNAGLWLPPEAILKSLGDGEGERLLAHLEAAPERVFNLIERYRIDCEPVRNGTLHCAHSAAGLRDLNNRLRQQQARGAPVTLLDGGETARRTGVSGFHGALHDARAGTVQPLALCRGLARAAQEAGASVHAHSPVLRLAREGAAWVVETAEGAVSARSLLLATNAYHRLAAGVPAPQSVPLYFFQAATAPLDERERSAVVPGGEGCWDTAMVMSSFRLDRAGRLIIGAIGNLEGPGARVHADWAQRKLAQLFPRLGHRRLESAWCGRIAVTGDHIPKIVDLGGGYCCFGYSGRGIGPGVTFGTLAAQALLREDATLLPISPVIGHRERCVAVRQGYYEAGSILMHTIAAR
ncbi:NAD(P)/FAD-dependent oxidoreductase [Sedimenticola hydrogenitrophicus]|uniref:NAD(P)/FAD-dependent oxidoreductase n=1 Tax=Sedimenticola hydrogenitrophicus TaxID=2967975 RepID=UPI0021A7BE77|nr:FAD-binding oxidoreductase [Sedimenticola hydrogenitrophicus]